IRGWSVTGVQTCALPISQISAQMDSVLGSTNLTVVDAVLVSIEVTPTNPSLPVGGTQQLIATGIFSDDSTLDLTNDATWSSDNEIGRASCRERGEIARGA